MIEDLAQKIWDRSAFQNEYNALLRQGLIRSLRVYPTRAEEIDEEILRRLLQTATHFSSSSNQKFRQAAYRIATATFELFGQEYDNLRNISSIVLGRLGNFPTVTLLGESTDDSSFDSIPAALWFDYFSKQAENSIAFDGSQVILTDFQRRLWKSLQDRTPLAVTAPTSAGKSFALQRFIASSYSHDPSWYLYIVPTRALINQVSASLTKLLHDLHQRPTPVYTIPVAPSEIGASTGIYVLTQERLQLLLDSDPSIKFGLAAIDEAQILGDGGRGVILESVIAKLRTRAPGIQLLFGSPQTRNPNIFQSIFSLETLSVVEEQESPVAQNLIFIDTDPIARNEVRISALIQDAREELPTVRVGTPLFDVDQRLAYLSWFFGRGDKNLVYTGGQARCETVAGFITQLIQDENKERINEGQQLNLLVDFSAFLKEHIHPEYLLAETVLSGVGFHYANIPAVVRRTMEDFFCEGILDFIVCTSTLLHGVNLPAKNLFLLNPTKGIDWDTRDDIPINSIEFWNLAGRAGRLGKEFQGNVYLIDHSQWQSDPLLGQREQTVEASSVKTLRDETTDFLKFISNTNHASGTNPSNENTFMKLFIDCRHGELDKTLTRIFGPEPSSPKKLLTDQITEAVVPINVPDRIIEKHLSVSAYRQQEMLDYLVEGIKEKEPTRYIPLHPLGAWREVSTSISSLFRRIHVHFQKIPPTKKGEYYFAPLAIRWMRGDPIRMLIDSAIDYKKKKQKHVNVSTTIRSVLTEIERDLRFRYVKFTSCYIDLLAEALHRTGNDSFIAHIPSIPLYLEVGASSRTMVNLVGLGLTRTAAAIVAEHAVNKEMDREQLERFLVRHNWKASGVSPIILREIHSILPEV